MYGVLEKKKMCSDVTFMRIEAPHVIENAKPGQFVVIKIHEKGERIPLTIVETDVAEKSVTIIFQEVGKTTKELATLNPGSSVSDIIGPLGHPTPIEKYGRVVCIGGGVGTAEVYPVARALRQAGNEITSIIGARNKGLLFLVDEMKALSCEFHVTTDDGSYGRKGLVTDVLKELLGKNRYGLVYTVGPILMMKAVADMTRSCGIKTLASLNANMVDATGMCGTCRVTVGGQTKFTCVDGPDFDAHRIDFVELINRDSRFKAQQEESLRRYEKTRRAGTD